MNIKALKYFHYLCRKGYSHGAARNSTLYKFSDGFEDWAKRMQRYVGIRIFYGSEGELMQSLNRKARTKFRY